MSDRALEEPQVTEAAQGAALDVFVRFTERTNTVHHPQVLIETAADLLYEAIPSATIAFHPAQRDHWSVLARRGAISPEVRAVQDRGLPRDEPQLLRPFQQGGPLFFEWDPGVAMIPEAASYQVVAYYPYWREGVPFGFFGMGSLAGPRWSARERAVFLALGCALQLALERAWHAGERETRIQELERQVHTGRVFAELTQDLTFNDPAALMREAQHLLFRLLPGASVQFWTRQDGEWKVTSRLGLSPPDSAWERLPEVEADLTGQLVLGELGRTERREVRGSGPLLGVLEVTLRDPWTRPDLAVLETVAEYLGLALDRARQSRMLLNPQPLLNPAEGLGGRLRAAEERERAALAAQQETLALSEAVWQDLRREITRLGRTREGAEVRERLGQLGERVDALLAYAEVSRRPLRRVLLSLTTLVLSVKAELEGGESGRRVRWKLGELPTVRADRELLRLALFELLSNALKFTRGREEARIEVGSRPQEGGGVAVFVRDNGRGFAPGLADLLFGVFDRAHEDVEGLGMGLAVVQRVVERHGGRVWGEGRPGKGATFGFTLPTGVR